ncbi:NAD(P)-dependent oxidoreductase [Aspergillus clavatus NRRL 1]|uniref:Oxidoreductase, putative n=1 Tax=Aspergillus clavatus (strain ATCC 1007 / CBS 513.65 / DSM 816 / NCTC 3887 / NRRL 1 / QM 1276 / 107) TaxID=344612 RepID=A1C6K2_ASPCL|nr:oxidoreductase, putative [Aspergillus clavatus NRRL 1]EAW14023.1 oxidoreductase, putative [Aspergillus clavatus NRRL 1]
MAEERVAWLGLGNIGRGMSKNIAQKGPQTSLVLYNRTVAKAVAFAETLGPNKATVASTIPDAVRDASLVFICVGDDHALDQIISTILADPTIPLAGKVIADCSTVHPDTSRRMHAALADRGAAFVACPVFGAPAFADAGQLVVVPAGDAAAVARLKPFLDGVTARATIDMSGPDDVGRATTLKILGNTFILNTVETLAEGLVAAEKAGLGADVYQQWIHALIGGMFAKYADRMCSGDYYTREEPLFAVDLARKDLRHAATLAGEAGMRMRSVEVTDGYLEALKEERGEKGDIAGIYGAVRKESGLPFENDK